MDDVAPAPDHRAPGNRAPDRGAPVVVAGVAPVARLVTAALLRAGHDVVGLVDPVDDPEPVPADLGTGRYVVTDDPTAAAGFTIALVADSPDDDAALSAVERYTAALAPLLHPGGLLVVSSPTAEYTGGIVVATVELLTGLRAGVDYGLAHLFEPVPNGRLIASGLDVASATRAEEWLSGLGLAVMPVLPIAAAEVVAGLLAGAARPDDETDPGGG